MKHSPTCKICCLAAAVLLATLLPSCQKKEMAATLEESLSEMILEPWYPRIIDSTHGGYLVDLEHDWTVSASPQQKVLVQQARHLWATTFIFGNFPQKEEFLEYATHGFRFLQEHLWDKEFGGFYYSCSREGNPAGEMNGEKRIYGQAFALYGLSQYYRVSADPEALDLAVRTFRWMDAHAHDPLYGGYFEHLNRDGTPVQRTDDRVTGSGDAPVTGLKDYNSSIHLMEALTALYGIWPDTMVRERLEEMFFLVRDTFVHPDGYLQLFFYPDWTLVPAGILDELAVDGHWYTQHVTFGHDVETAFLLLETAAALGMEGDRATRQIAKTLVDHSLEWGWDPVEGGFFDAAKHTNSGMDIIIHHKSWWSQAEGLNALLLMHTLYPDDPAGYYGYFTKMWEYIDHYLIDHVHGGWYNYGLDTFPENSTQRKSHAWKTTYHNVRAMIHCIRMLEKF